MNKKRKPIRLNASFLRKVTNNEFYTFNDQFHPKLDRDFIEDPHIFTYINNLKRHTPTIEMLLKAKTAHSSSGVIDRKTKACRGLLTAIRGIVDGLSDLTDDRGKELYETLYDWIREVRPDMGKLAKNRQFAVVLRLYTEYDANSAIADAVEEVGANFFFDRIVATHKQIGLLRSGRESDLTVHQDARDGFREQVVLDIQLLLSALTGMANMPGENQENYYDLCLEIKTLLKNTNAIYLSRDTRNEKKRLEQDNDMGDDQEEYDGSEDGIIGDDTHDPDSHDESDWDDDTHYDH